MTIFTQKERFIFQFLILSIAIGVGVGAFRKKYSKPNFTDQINNEISEFKIKSNNIEKALIIDTQEILSKTDDIKPKISVTLLNINTAIKSDLIQLPKIGPVTAGRIIKYRDKNGPFKTFEDLLKIKGIGSKTLDQLKPYIQIK
jgi:competence protein ComEA